MNARVSEEALKRIKTLKLRREAIIEARTDLISFVELMRPHPDDPDDPLKSTYDPQMHHRYIADELMAVLRGEILREIIVLPPRAGKTELATKHLAPFVLGQHPNWNVIVGTYNSTYANDLGRSIRDVTVSEPYQQVFPEVELRTDARSIDRMVTQQGGGIVAVGRGEAITGRGGQIILLDDPIKDRAEADSLTVRNMLWQWLTQVVLTRFMSDKGAIVLTMTRWHEDDPVGRLTDPRNPHYHSREAKKWRTVRIPAIAEEGDVLGRKVGTPLWPARFSKSYLKSMEALDPRGFSALYQGRPADKTGNFFREQDIVTYAHRNELPKQLRYYAASDHAVSTRQQNDPTCIGIIGVDEADDLWLLPDLFWKRVDTNTAVNAITFYIKRYRPVFWWAESGQITKSFGPFLRKRMAEEQAYCCIDDLTPAADKQTRAQSIQGRIAMGRVHFPAFAHWWPDAKHEMLSFPAGTHDDFVDMIALFGLGLDRVRLGKGLPRRQDEVPATGTYAWVRYASDKRKKYLKQQKETSGW